MAVVTRGLNRVPDIGTHADEIDHHNLFRQRWLPGTLLALLLLTPASIVAQPPSPEAAMAPALPTIPVTPPEPATGETAQSDSDEDPVQLQAIVVTGEKLGRSLEESATSATVFGAANLEAHGDTSLHDLLRRIPNTAATEEGGLSIRGISQAGAAGGNFGLATNTPLISVVVDDATLDRTAQQGATEDLFDVEQVEVLRGAQSTNQGRNAMAGAVIVNTRDPLPIWDARLRLSAGSRDGRGIAFAGGGPLAESLAFRIAATHKEEDGFVTHVFRDEPDFARSRSTLLRGKLAWEPRALGRYASLLTVSTGDDRRQPDYNIEDGIAGTDPRLARTTTVNEFTLDRVRSTSASWRNTLELNEHIELIAVIAGLDSRQQYDRDYDGTEEDSGVNLIDNDSRNLTQELRARLSHVPLFGRELRGVFGLYGGRFEEDYISISRDVRATAGSLSPLPVPIGGDALAVRLDFDQTQRSRAGNFAVFGEFDLQLPSDLTATLGLRYDRERLDSASLFEVARGDAFLQTPAALPQLGLIDPLLAQQRGVNVLPLLALAGLTPSTNGEQRARTTYTALLPKLGLRWAFHENAAVFVQYVEAYRPGGVDVDFGTGAPLPYDPEYTRTLETGLRADWLQGRLDAALNLFMTDYRDQQVPVPNGPLFVTENAGRSELRGGELSLNWWPLRQLRLDLAAGVVRTRFLDYRTTSADFTGNEFIFAPRETASLGATWRFTERWQAAASLTHRARAFSTPANTSDERSDARQLLDLRLAYEGSFVSAALAGRNLLDQDYVTESYQFRSGYIGAPTPRGYASYSAPRSVSLQVELRL